MAGRTRSSRKTFELEPPVLSNDDKLSVKRARKVTRNGDPVVLADVVNLRNSHGKKKRGGTSVVESVVVPSPKPSSRMTRSGKRYTSVDVVDKVMEGLTEDSETLTEEDDQEMDSQDSTGGIPEVKKPKGKARRRNKPLDKIMEGLTEDSETLTEEDDREMDSQDSTGGIPEIKDPPKRKARRRNKPLVADVKPENLRKEYSLRSRIDTPTLPIDPPDIPDDPPIVPDDPSNVPDDPSNVPDDPPDISDDPLTSPIDGLLVDQEEGAESSSCHDDSDGSCPVLEIGDCSPTSHVSSSDEDLMADEVEETLIKNDKTSKSNGDRLTAGTDVISGCGQAIYGHQKQIEILRSLMGKPNERAPPLIFIHGEEAVGKTHVIKCLLSNNNQQIHYSHVSLKECYSPRILYESILNNLSGVAPSSSNQYKGYAHCDNLVLFIRELRNIVISRKWEGQTTYIVLDDFQCVLGFERTVLLALTRLEELTELNLCVIVLSRYLWEKYDIPFDVIQIQFPQYTRAEVMEILVQDCPPEFTRSFYREYLNHIYDLHHTVTRSIKELRYTCSKLFPVYCEPIKAGKATVKDSLKLWHHLRPVCQEYLSTTYTRRASQSQMTLKTSKQGVANKALPMCPTSLPHFSNYLLIASYLASYNPSKHDQKFFSEKRSKKKRTKSTKSKKESEIKRQLQGPRPFTLDRMLTIFQSITEGDVIVTTPLLTQISTLVKMGLLAQVSPANVLDIMKYKCMMTFEAIREISKIVNFEIVRYLSDYN